MKTWGKIGLGLGISIAILALYNSLPPSSIKHYSAEELAGITCGELGDRHEDVIFAHHDAAIRQYRKAGAFPDDLGLPNTADLPYVVLMEKFILDNDLKEFDLHSPRSLTISGPFSKFFAEITSVCAAKPSLDASTAIGQAAVNLNLVD